MGKVFRCRIVLLVLLSISALLYTVLVIRSFLGLSRRHGNTGFAALHQPQHQQTISHREEEHLHQKHAQYRTAPSTSPTTTVQLPVTTTSDSLHFTESRFKHDLYRCSRALGTREISILENQDAFNEVATRAQTFLRGIQTLLPRNFSSKYKNPCWIAEKPKRVYHGWEDHLMVKFHPEHSKVGDGFSYLYSHYLTKPVNESLVGHQLLCLPYFFLAGFPKSATTSIYTALTEHQEIVEPTEKEPHWWTRVLSLSNSKYFSAEYFPISIILYTLFFKRAATEISSGEALSSKLVTFDGSQCILWDSNFFVNGQDYCAMPAVMSRVLPNAKFVVVMRNPITRLYSHYWFSSRLHCGTKRAKYMRNKAAAWFHLKVKQDIESFHSCSKNWSVFECSSLRAVSQNAPPPPGVADNMELYWDCFQIWHRLTIGLYSLHIKKWLQFYPRKNFLFLRMEDISKDPLATMTKITDFLEIEPVSQASANVMLQKKENSLPDKIYQDHPLDSQSRKILEDFYRPYNEDLARLTDNPLFLWQDQDN